MQQGVSHAGVWNLETIYVKHGNHGMGGPTFVMSFGSQNARDLGLALIAAADALEAAVSGRCDECGSATTRAPGLCHECLVAANVARFRNLHAVD
ncbi:MAG: hypothetical protein BGO47_06760 [Microbacterium sp. 67-17]|nr:MAG: hypothetical protein BGO47_06760 [Microbacterium sp. 67-17]